MLDFGCRYRLISIFFFFNKKSVSHAFVCLVNIVRIAVDHYFDTVMMEFIVNYRTDASKTDVKLLPLARRRIA